MNLLHEFFNHRSDACPLEALQQEKLEKEFQEWFDNHLCECSAPPHIDDTILEFCGSCKKRVQYT